MLAYSRRYPENCKQTDTDPETGCMEFDIEKGRFSFRLTAPYSEERREAEMCIRDSRYIKYPFHSFPFPKSLSLRERGTAAGTEAKGSDRRI